MLFIMVSSVSGGGARLAQVYSDQLNIARRATEAQEVQRNSERNAQQQQQIAKNAVESAMRNKEPQKIGGNIDTFA